MKNDDWLELLNDGAQLPLGIPTERALHRWQTQRPRRYAPLLALVPAIVAGAYWVTCQHSVVPGGRIRATEESFRATADAIRATADAIRVAEEGNLVREEGSRVTPHSARVTKNLAKPPLKRILRPIGVVDDLSLINADPLQTFTYWCGQEAPQPVVPERDGFIVVPAPLLASETPEMAVRALEQAKQAAQIVDARLQKRVTLEGKALAFSELCRLLSEKTGVAIEASRAVADDKLTVFCTERSLRDILRQVSAIFGFVWERTGEEGAYRYRLTQPLRARLAEEELRNKDAHDALIALDEELGRLAKYADLSPDELLDRAAQTDDPEKKRQLQNLAMRSSGPMRLYNQLAPEDLKALQAGKKLEFRSNPRKPGEKALPTGIEKSILGAFAERGRIVVGSNGQVELSVNDNMETQGPRTGEGQSPATLSGTEALSWLELKRDELGQMSLFGGSGFAYGEGDKANFMLCNAPVAEGRSPSHRPDNAKENAALAKDPLLAKRPRALPKTSAERTTAELLEAFHQASGMDVMGDSFTGLHPDTVLRRAPQPSLFALLSSACDALNLRWRYEKPTPADPRPLLSFRTTDFFNRRPQEIPNRLIAHWEALRMSEGALKVEPLCELARLTDEQLDSRANADYLTQRSKLIEWRWVVGLKAHWRLLAALTSSQRAQALESGVPFTSLTFPLQEQFLHNIYAHRTSSAAEWPAQEWQREAQFSLSYAPLKPGDLAPKLCFSYSGLRSSESGPRLLYTEDERFNRYGPRPEK